MQSVLISCTLLKIMVMTVVKLVLNPYEPNYKSVGPFSLMVHAPLNNVAHTKHLPPNLQDLLPEEPDKKHRTVNLSLKPNLQELEFNLDSTYRHTVRAGDRHFLITLLHIGEEELPQEPGRKYLYFYFQIQEII